MSTEKPQRYSAPWVSLHWAIALLLLAEFILGFSTRFISQEKWQFIIGWHMPLGSLILILMVIRIIIRWRTPRPEQATIGIPLLDKMGELTHYLLYIFAILMPLAGIALASSYGLTPIQLGAGLQWLPGLHRIIAPILALLIFMHLSAALYHQVIRKDKLFSRMWYEKKNKN